MNCSKINNFIYNIKNKNKGNGNGKGKDDIFFTSIIQSKLLENNNPCIYKSHDTKYLNFTANTVENVIDFFNNKTLNEKYTMLIKLLWCIQKQNETLKKYGHGFYNICLNSILVVDSSIFIFINSDYIKQITNNKYNINFPFIPNDHLLPEMNLISSLPTSITTNCFNYSLGSIVFTILCKKIFKPCLNLKIELICIYKTKLYWCITRCLKDNNLFLI